jgi:hypothetical protein
LYAFLHNLPITLITFCGETWEQWGKMSLWRFELLNAHSKSRRRNSLKARLLTCLRDGIFVMWQTRLKL